jgi:hypothetical protein
MSACPHGLDKLPEDANGLRLAKYVKGDDLILCEPVMFVAGRPAVDTTLRRAAISGRVEVDGEILDHFADIMSDPDTMTGQVALDAKSYSALKNHWMRCRIWRPTP